MSRTLRDLADQYLQGQLENLPVWICDNASSYIKTKIAHATQGHALTILPLALVRLLTTGQEFSNTACADLLARVKHDALKTVVLMHLSESNNHPEIAMDSARRVLGDHPATLFPARQSTPTVLIPVE